MKSKSRFYVGFFAAALTFGTLMATLGPHRFMHHRNHCCANQCAHDCNNNAADAQRHVPLEGANTTQQ